MFGTSSVRVPSDFSMVDREPEVDVLVAHDARRAVDDAEARVHARHASAARATTAKPMRCVKLTLPPRSRARWLFRI